MPNDTLRASARTLSASPKPFVPDHLKDAMLEMAGIIADETCHPLGRADRIEAGRKVFLRQALRRVEKAEAELAAAPRQKRTAAKKRLADAIEFLREVDTHPNPARPN